MGSPPKATTLPQQLKYQISPCIRKLRPRYERQSKPWCPVFCQMHDARPHDALGSRLRLRFRMLQLKTPVFCGL